MRFHIVTLFPGAFDSYLGESIIKRAIEDKKIKVSFYNPRDFAPKEKTNTEGKAVRIDRKPYGGGPGMVIQALPVVKAIEAAQKAIEKIVAKEKNKKILKQATSEQGDKKQKVKKPQVKIIFLSPQGKQLDTEYAKKSAQKYTDVIIVCGRYEGIDARIKKVFKMEDISIGPFVITGGELGAMLIVDSFSRQIPGVLGDIESLEESRVASSDVYTRPDVFEYKKKKYRVPKVLLSGNHKDIEDWRQKH